MSPSGSRRFSRQRRAQHRARRLAFLEPLLGRAVGAELAPGQVAEADAMSERHVFRDRPAETDFEIVGMRAKDEQVNVHRHGRLDYPNTSMTSLNAPQPLRREDDRHERGRAEREKRPDPEKHRRRR